MSAPITLQRAALLRPGSSLHVRLYTGDALDRLREMPDQSVHCAITSPPYYRLRDFGVAGQIGLEPTPSKYVARLVEVLRELRRVLRDDATLWLNMGDSYCASGGDYGAKPKDLLGIPWMVAFALRADGWYLRSEIIWHKLNPMPDSTKDRPTRSHEQLFLLSKSANYYYDAAAIAEPSDSDGEVQKVPVPSGWDTDPGAHRTIHQKGRPALRYAEIRMATRNKRSVWTIATEPFPDAHFATFPSALVEPCILAGTSEKGVCAACGAPWIRQTETEYRRHDKWFGNKQDARHNRGKAGTAYNEPIATRTTDWQPTCDCNAGTVAATVLDPFAGSGTVGLVADRLGRDAVLIELNPDYVQIARKRLLTS